MIDFRNFSGITPTGGAGLLSGILSGLKSRGQSQLGEDKLAKEQQLANLGYAQKGIDPSRVQDPEYLAELSQRQQQGSGLFGESKDPLISTLRLMNTKGFEELPPEQQKAAADYVKTKARGFDTLGGQAFSSRTGDLQARQAIEPQLAGDIESSKQSAALGAKRDFGRAEALRGAGFGVEKTENINKNILDIIESNPDLVGGYSNIKASGSRYGIPGVGYNEQEQEKRGALIRGLSEAQNKAMALATAAGQSGINIQAEIDRITQGLQPTNTKAEIKGALGAMQDLESFVANQLRGEQPQQQIQQPVQQPVQQQSSDPLGLR